jgi:hypothetical protein
MSQIIRHQQILIRCILFLPILWHLHLLFVCLSIRIGYRIGYRIVDCCDNRHRLLRSYEVSEKEAHKATNDKANRAA